VHPLRGKSYARRNCGSMQGGVTTELNMLGAGNRKVKRRRGRCTATAKVLHITQLGLREIALFAVLWGNGDGKFLARHNRALSFSPKVFGWDRDSKPQRLVRSPALTRHH
jgi:hypothetical protein